MCVCVKEEVKAEGATTLLSHPAAVHHPISPEKRLPRRGGDTGACGVPEVEATTHRKPG